MHTNKLETGTMSSGNVEKKKELKKMLYVFRVVNLQSETAMGEIARESFAIMESLPRDRNRHKPCRWRTFSQPPNPNHFENSPCSQGTENCIEGNGELNRKVRFGDDAMHFASEELNLLYDVIAKPTDVHLIANTEGKLELYLRSSDGWQGKRI